MRVFHSVIPLKPGIRILAFTTFLELMSSAVSWWESSVTNSLRFFMGPEPVRTPCQFFGHRSNSFKEDHHWGRNVGPCMYIKIDEWTIPNIQNLPYCLMTVEPQKNFKKKITFVIQKNCRRKFIVRFGNSKCIKVIVHFHPQ